MQQGRDYKIKIHTAAHPVRIHKLLKVLDASELNGELAKQEIGRHDVADVILETRQPIAFDLTSDIEVTGRFVIVDGYDVAGGGIITASVTDEQDNLRTEARLRDFSWVHGAVGLSERARRFGHLSALIMFVGRPDSGKERYARALEKALFADQRNAYLLDGTNVLLGVDHDLTIDATQHELVRRFGEVAYLFLSAGTMLISTTNAIGLADHSAVQALIGSHASIAIEVDPSGRSTLPCDLRISGREPEAEVVTRVIDFLAQRGVFQVPPTAS
jgi:bifunctional enzyme CysN/CysC